MLRLGNPGLKPSQRAARWRRGERGRERFIQPTDRTAFSTDSERYLADVDPSSVRSSIRPSALAASKESVLPAAAQISRKDPDFTTC